MTSGVLVYIQDHYVKHQLIYSSRVYLWLNRLNEANLIPSMGPTTTCCRKKKIDKLFAVLPSEKISLFSLLMVFIGHLVFPRHPLHSSFGGVVQPDYIIPRSQASDNE